jgi:hypothetical protein
MAALIRFDADPSQADVRKGRSMLRPVLMVACAFALTIAASGKVFAQDDEDDDQTFEQKIIGNLMKGIGAKSMDNSGIDYRERSPLVIPPSTALPPPEDKAKVAVAPNWPKDPDITKNKKAAAERKRTSRVNNTDKAEYSASNPISSTELNRGIAPQSSIARSATNPDEPGGMNPRPMTPTELGYKGNLFSNMFGRITNDKETATFTGEPERSSLIQPPTGYQTPSPNYSYGVDPNTKDSSMLPTAAEQRISKGSPN